MANLKVGGRRDDQPHMGAGQSEALSKFYQESTESVHLLARKASACVPYFSFSEKLIYQGTE